MRKATALLILSLMVPTLVGAQDLASLEQQRKAAEQGNTEAQVDMGILYEFGFNMPKNDVNALAWYMRAAEQGNALAITRRDQLKSRMKPEEIEAAQKLSQELTVKKPETMETPKQPDAPLPAETSPAPPPPEEKPASSP